MSRAYVINVITPDGEALPPYSIPEDVFAIGDEPHLLAAKIVSDIAIMIRNREEDGS